ncbi:MAG: hypothetical protein WBM09_07075 [Gallionella sp.]
MNLQINDAFVRKIAPALLVSLCAVVAVMAYLQALNYPFILDDFVYIVWNTKLPQLHLAQIWKLLVVPYNDTFEFLPLRDLPSGST